MSEKTTNEKFAFDDSELSPEQQEIVKNFRHDMENSPIRMLTKKEREVYGTAMYKASQYLPSFRDALAILSPYMDATCSTAYTDQFARVGLSYWFFHIADTETRAFCLLHESMHVLNSHFSRAEREKLRPKMMNYGGDLEINSNLSTIDKFSKLVDKFLIPKHHNFPDYKTMEQYISLLNEEMNKMDREDEENDSSSDSQDGSEESDGSAQGSDSSGQGDKDSSSQDSSNSGNGSDGSGSGSSNDSSDSDQGEGSESDSGTEGSGSQGSSGSQSRSTGYGSAYDNYNEEIRGNNKKGGGSSLDRLRDERDGNDSQDGDGSGDGSGSMDSGDGNSTSSYSGNGGQNGQQQKVRPPVRNCDDATSQRSNAADDIGVEKSSIVEQNIARRNTRSRIVEELNKDKSYSNGSNDMFLKLALNGMTPPKVDWRDLFRNILANCYNKAMIGRNHSSYKRVNRRYTQGKIIFPGTIDYMPTAMFGIDTSGSMDTQDFSKLLIEIEDIIKNALRAKNSLKVFSIDTTIKNVQPVTSVDSIDLFGGGGTDMSVGFAYVNSLKKNEKPDIFILGTDGGTDWNRVVMEAKKATYQSVILVTHKECFDEVPAELFKYSAVLDISSNK